MKSPFLLKITTLNNMDPFTTTTTKTLMVGLVLLLKCVNNINKAVCIRCIPVSLCDVIQVMIHQHRAARTC